MPQIYVRPTNGNDANNGLTYLLAKQSLNAAFSVAVSGDEIVLAGDEGNHTINSLITIAYNCVMYTYPGHQRAVIVGSQHINGTIGMFNLRDIYFNNGTTSGATIQSSATGHSIIATNCDFGRPIVQRGNTSSRFIFLKCKFLWAKNSSIRTNPIFQPTAVAGNYIFDECDLTGPLASTSFDWSASPLTITNSKLYFGPTTGKIRITAVPGNYIFFDYNTIDDETSVINYTSASTVTTNNIGFFRNYINCSDQIIKNNSTGTLSMESVGTSFYNILSTSTLTTGYSSISDATTAAPQFYNASINDYNIEIDSPLANYNGDIVGAMSPDWEGFYSSIPEAKVELNYAYKDRSRTNNKLGSLASAGETDGDKVLTTSTAITGNINPNTVLDTNTNGTLPSSAVKASNGGTLPLNKIAPSQGGSYLGEESNDTLDASKLLIGYNPTSKGSTVTGTADVDALANLPTNTNVLEDSGNYGKGLNIVPALPKAKVMFDAGGTLPLNKVLDTNGGTLDSAKVMVSGGGTLPLNKVHQDNGGTLDLPALSSVDPLDTLEGISGTMDIPALNRVSPNDTLRGVQGTQDLPSLSNIAPDDSLEGSSGTMDLPALNKVAPTDTLRGDAGTMDLPSLSSIDPLDTLEGQSGTLDLPALNKVAPSDTLRGQSGTLDLPSLSSVDPADTLEGLSGTLDLPSLNSILLTDTLKGVNGTVRLPTPDLVAINYNYGPNDSLTGELSGANLANFTFLLPNEVKSGKVYLYDGTSYTGTFGYRTPVAEGEVIKNITASIKEEIVFVLDDSSFKELQYVNDIDKNSFKNNFRRYGVLAKTANEIAGPFGFITLEQGFDFILTDGFINKPMNDDIQRERTLFLQDQCYQIYKTLQKTKCGIPNTCINVKDLIISEPQYIEKDNVIVMTSNIKVIYRQRI